jgi:hypothetical protein
VISESLYLLGLALLTSAAAGAAGVRFARLPASALRPALVRLLEWAGLAAAFYVANLLAGVAAVALLRRLTGEFLSLYMNTDTTLLALSALQAIVLQWWRAESPPRAPSTDATGPRPGA